MILIQKVFFLYIINQFFEIKIDYSFSCLDIDITEINSFKLNIKIIRNINLLFAKEVLPLWSKMRDVMMLQFDRCVNSSFKHVW